MEGSAKMGVLIFNLGLTIQYLPHVHLVIIITMAKYLVLLLVYLFFFSILFFAFCIFTLHLVLLLLLLGSKVLAVHYASEVTQYLNTEYTPVLLADGWVEYPRLIKMTIFFKIKNKIKKNL
jgi:hypothetical protein